MKMSGELIKDQLSNELGFEADRARTLPRDVTAGEIAIFWKESKSKNSRLKFVQKLETHAMLNF